MLPGKMALRQDDGVDFLIGGLKVIGRGCLQLFEERRYFGTSTIRISAPVTERYLRRTDDTKIGPPPIRSDAPVRRSRRRSGTRQPGE